ncbi:MAG: cytochrome c family protein [Kordiimonadaceae bacterium]|nr:cytochrome c family protein [Kordiimonadaceae bacterium]
MNSFEFNKVFAAVLATGLFILVLTIFSESFFHHDDLKKPAFAIEVAEVASTATVEEELPSLAVMLAGADLARGAREWNKCKACHTSEKGGANKLGPNLFGIVGRSVAADESFKYSNALSGQNVNWTFELLDQWIASPKSTFNGTSMGFGGIRKPAARANLLAYLRTLSDAPVNLPAVEVMAEKAEEMAADTMADKSAETAAH